MVALNNPDTDRKRRNAHRRARRAGRKIEEAVMEIYQKPIDEWDLDELSRGRPRAVDGTWKGGSPKWVTPAVKNEAKRRFQIMGRQMLRDELTAAVRVVADLASNTDLDDDGHPEVPASVRLNAATYLIDQVLGRATARVEVEAGDGLRDFLAGSLVLPGGKPAVIIQGEVVDEDLEDEIQDPI